MATSLINSDAQRKIVEQLIDEREKRERRIVLIGKSGHGKSSSGNSICAAKVFATSPGTSSLTKHYQAWYRPFDSMNLIVYDTPGLFDTKDSLSVIKAEIGLAITMASPGPHAFLIHFKIGNRFTDEEKKTVEYIQEIFGENAHKYCILVLTGEDNLSYDNETVEHYLENADAGLKRLLEQCHNRYITINNRSQQQEIDEKVRQLLKIIDTMLLNTQTRYYTNQQFEKAEQDLQEREKNQIEAEIQKREAEKQALREEISQELEKHQKDLEKEKEDLEKLVKDLRRQARDEAAAQQRASMFQTFCSIIPPAINAAAPIVNTYFETNKNTDDPQANNSLSNTNNRQKTSSNQECTPQNNDGDRHPSSRETERPSERIDPMAAIDIITGAVSMVRTVIGFTNEYFPDLPSKVSSGSPPSVSSPNDDHQCHYNLLLNQDIDVSHKNELGLNSKTDDK